MKEKVKDWFFLVTAIAFALYLSTWLHSCTTLLIRGGVRAY